ncbi:MAG TPA: hypothetical protein P5243_09880 [Bacteroidales bacterium]|jgi:hypothetical protein|nr:hypothetical protein [Bacteroidales bacterium]HRS19802.1 hypothetical protein [Bacteroidales bacterium]
MKQLRIIIVLVCAFGFHNSMWAQQKKSAIDLCDNYMNDGFISDGQYYSHSIQKDEIKQTKITLMGGNTYRIAACAEQSKQLQFSIIDVQGNILFTNTQFNYAPYWDFEIKHTIECTITLQNNDKTLPKDKTILIIGYKR